MFALRQLSVIACCDIVLGSITRPERSVGRGRVLKVMRMHGVHTQVGIDIFQPTDSVRVALQRTLEHTQPNADVQCHHFGSGSRLPANIASLIDRYEVLAGGVQISQGFSLYNVLVKAKEVLEGSKCDATLGHPEIVRETSYVTATAITGTNPEVYAPPGSTVSFGICSCCLHFLCFSSSALIQKRRLVVQPGRPTNSDDVTP